MESCRSVEDVHSQDTARDRGVGVSIRDLPDHATFTKRGVNTSLVGQTGGGGGERVSSLSSMYNIGKV